MSTVHKPRRAVELGVELRPSRHGWSWAVLAHGRRYPIAAEGASRWRLVAVLRLAFAAAFVAWFEARRAERETLVCWVCGPIKSPEHFAEHAP